MTTRYLTIPNPAAGADWTFTPSKSDPTHIISVLGLLTTSAVANSRVPAVQVKDQGGLLVAYMAPSVSQAASLAGYWQFLSADLGASFAGLYATGASVSVAQMPGMWLPPGWSVNAKTYLIDVADQWSGLTVTYEIHESAQDELREMVADAVADAAMH